MFGANLNKSRLAMALGIAAVSGMSHLEPMGMHPSVVKTAMPKHRRAGTGPGTKANQRVARKRRNVQRNRSAHRG